MTADQIREASSIVWRKANNEYLRERANFHFISLGAQMLVEIAAQLAEIKERLPKESV